MPRTPASEAAPAALTRRRLIAAAPAAALGTFLLDPGRTVADEASAAGSPTMPPAFPTQEPSLVREMVGVSHGDVARVRELVAARPELAKAAWDWGFGDWETALGAASHVGNREIAELLIDNGARPDLFTAAMLGGLDVVQAAVAARPGIQRQHGPHGITLLAHARAGGEPAAPVVRFLERLGDADRRYPDEPLSDAERQALLGTYAFAAAAADRFEVSLDRRGALTLRRGDGTPRVLYHQGGNEFHPAGAPSARIRFEVPAGPGAGPGEGAEAVAAATALTVHNPGLVVRAERVEGGR